LKNEKSSSSKASLLSRWRNRDKKEIVENTAITPIPDGIPVPLSREQKRLWFLQQLFPNNPFYNYSELYRLQGDIQATYFEKSIRLIEETHDILRANFQVKEGIPTVKTSTSSKSLFRYYDFSDETYDIASAKANEIVRKNASHAFHLSDETLVQSTLIKVAPNNFLFLIVMHHIITDKWSMKVFRKELASHYAKLIKGETPVIEKPKIQYASYAYSQNNQNINNEHLNYWKQKLSGEIPVLNLPTDYPKKTQPSYKGTFHKQVYSKQVATNFFELCKKLEATPYVTMLSVYYVLLQKYANQDDILIGTPITKRDKTSLENLIGFFNDTLVLRTNVNKKASFIDLVKAVKQTTLDAFSNKDISFDTLVKTVKPTRSLSVHPFFQVMFLYHKVPETPTLGEDITITYEPYDAGVAKFDLTLYISEDEGDLMSLMEYETDLFEATTIKRMHAHFEEILKTVIQNPANILDEITIQTTEEEAFFRQIENPSEVINTNYNGIHELITEKALENPTATAVVFKNDSITYANLNERATKIAGALLVAGVKQNDIVGLCIERSVDMIVGLLGILKAGAAYLPLDPEYPSDRISYILKDAAAKIVVTQQEFTDSFNNKTTTILTIEGIQEQETPIEIDLPEIANESLAYVIYTSGSTGVPKGVPITHKNILSSTLARKTLDTVIVAGEACSTQLAALHFDNFPKIKLYNEYGPTEGTVWCIAHQLKKEDSNASSIPIGRPIQNVQVYILNENLQKVPYGSIGELCIGGLGLTKGYLNDTQKTEQAFITYTSKEGIKRRLYKTGDLAKFNANGTIEFLGRKDQQVKIRGYRIELDEIEQQINQHPTIQQNVVTVQNTTDNIDWATLETANTNQLLQTLKQHLSNKEIEAIFSSVEKIEEEAIDFVLQNLD